MRTSVLLGVTCLNKGLIGLMIEKRYPLRSEFNINTGKIFLFFPRIEICKTESFYAKTCG